MEIYFELIKKYFEKLEKKSQDSQHFFLLFIIFDISLHKKYSVKKKYLFLEKSLNNIFLSNEITNEILNIFCTIQKNYFALLRFKFILLYKKSKIVVDNDLSLNPISEKEKCIFTIYEKNKKYLFHIRDLLHIINSSIGQSDFFFSTPTSVKNPFNNAIFTKSILYNIYFFMRFNTNYFSELFHYFFLCNFDLSEFYFKYANVLRKYAIQDYLKNSSEKNLFVDIEDMIDDFNYENRLYKIIIDPDFPNKKLFNIMKPYLNLYILSKYSYLNCEKINAQNLLKKKLREFYTFNPNFGRKNIKIIKINNFFNKKSISETVIEFIEDHIPFYENSKKSNNFLLSHSYLKSD